MQEVNSWDSQSQGFAFAQAGSGREPNGHLVSRQLTLFEHGQVALQILTSTRMCQRSRTPRCTCSWAYSQGKLTSVSGSATATHVLGLAGHRRRDGMCKGNRPAT